MCGIPKQDFKHVCMATGTLYPQKLAITSPTSGGHSVGIVRSQAQTMEYVWPLINVSRARARDMGSCSNSLQSSGYAAVLMSKFPLRFLLG
jgi:hypothetical protein